MPPESEFSLPVLLEGDKVVPNERKQSAVQVGYFLVQVSAHLSNLRQSFIGIIQLEFSVAIRHPTNNPRSALGHSWPDRIPMSG